LTVYRLLLPSLLWITGFKSARKGFD